jgi:hypothetical protein
LVPVASSSGLGIRIAPAALSLAVGVLLQDLGDAEVEHLDGAGLGDEDVVGLEVAVDDALHVRARERAQDRDHDLHRAGVRQALAVLGQVGERLAAQELEHDVRRAAVLADLVDHDDVVVLAERGGARLDAEPLGLFGLVRLQELDRDAAAEPDIAGEEHAPHPALADHLDDLVLVDPDAGVQRRADRVDDATMKKSSGCGSVTGSLSEAIAFDGSRSSGMNQTPARDPRELR